MDELDYWTKKFFKLGIINGIRLKKEIKEESSKQKGFFNYEYSCFDEYLDGEEKKLIFDDSTNGFKQGFIYGDFSKQKRLV